MCCYKYLFVTIHNKIYKLFHYLRVKPIFNFIKDNKCIKCFNFCKKGKYP